MRAAACAASLTLTLAAGAWAQGPPPPPGPEHEILGRDVGVWDATIEMTFPGAPPMTMNGVETNTLMGGRWLVSQYESDMMGQPFEGRGITGWDPEKKVYFGVWVDTMSADMTHAESTYDSETKTMTGWMEMPDPMGGKTRAKTEATWPDEDTRIVKVFAPDGGPEPFMTFTYEKRK
jgi:hypothetical protein